MLQKTACYEIAKSRKANFRFTCNQNLIISDVAEADKEFVNAILEKYNVVSNTVSASGTRRESMACVAFNTCPLALAEAQRYLPTLIDKIEVLQQKHDIADESSLSA